MQSNLLCNSPQVVGVTVHALQDRICHMGVVHPQLPHSTDQVQIVHRCPGSEHWLQEVGHIVKGRKLAKVVDLPPLLLGVYIINLRNPHEEGHDEEVMAPLEEPGIAGFRQVQKLVDCSRPQHHAKEEQGHEGGMVIIPTIEGPIPHGLHQGFSNISMAAAASSVPA